MASSPPAIPLQEGLPVDGRSLPEQQVKQFLVLKNDGSKDALVALLRLNKIYQEQLPNMPKEYVVRLVFDKVHWSVVAFGEDCVLGGITFRTFSDRGFLEIAFCAVRRGQQTRGLGTSLMNHLKEYAKTEGIFHLLTMADNNATVFFNKQGFSSTVILEESWFKGYIKEYDGVTLMECLVQPSVDYIRGCQDLLEQQKTLVTGLIEKFKKNEEKQVGLRYWKEHPHTLLDASKIPGLKDSLWVYRTVPQGPTIQQRAVALRPALSKVWRAVCRNGLALLAADAKVNTEHVDARLETAQFYSTIDMFAADVRRLFKACRQAGAAAQRTDQLELDFKRMLGEVVAAEAHSGEI